VFCQQVLNEFVVCEFACAGQPHKSALNESNKPRMEALNGSQGYVYLQHSLLSVRPVPLKGYEKPGAIGYGVPTRAVFVELPKKGQALALRQLAAEPLHHLSRRIDRSYARRANARRVPCERRPSRSVS
jgi:hypothetical protein